ncbi:uncharacterized protein [Rutidosis leptorrhynchoides]|uniref:uncharacterized protein n=1 Tax=Rutidosis leptorrhynchoides TaxID=125765 RepID=UPI003A9A1826
MAGDGDSGLSKTTQVSSLDFGDPLYLHASDTSTTALISLKLKDDSYSAIRSNILLSEPLPSVKSAFATISREESHRGSSFSATTSKTPNTAFLVSKTFIIKRCYDIVGYPPGWVKRNNNTYNNMSGNKVVSNYSLSEANTNNSVSSMPFSNEQISKLMSLINDKSVGASAHSNMEGNFLNNNEFFNAHINKFFHPNSSKITENVNLGWTIDSGATQHMTVSTKNLFNVVNVTNLGLTVSHPNGTFAKVTTIGNLKLTNKIVLYDILVIPEYCDFIHVKSQRIGRQFGGLYMFDDKSVINGNCLNNYVYISNSLWHCRLGHPADPVLKIIKQRVGSDNSVDVGICDICHRAKQKTIKVIITDNGTEFINNRLSVFCSQNGIIHQTTCVYTPQQNGIVERKHRHLLNVARSLMFQCGIPLNMWPECILTSTYLINRLPSSVLSGSSPFKMVFGFEPNLSHLRVFGCMCFSTVLNESDKFKSRSEKCVFIGYSYAKKGYKLFSLDRKVVLFSRDVKFYENIFPFKTSVSDNQNDKNSFNHFDFFESGLETCIHSSSPNDEGGEHGNDSENDGSGIGSVDISDDSSSSGTQDTTATFHDHEQPPEGNNISENSSNIETNTDIEGNPDTIVEHNNDLNNRRSNRPRVFPSKYVDYQIDSKVRYPFSNVVCYSSLSEQNRCFVTQLDKSVDKSVEPKGFKEALLDNN